MIFEGNTAKDVKIAYIGGGSRGWAWILMQDLTRTKDIAGEVRLYDIDYEAARQNEQIGGKIEGSGWRYVAKKTIGEALSGADFVIISILPGTFDEMESDVHVPEKYGIYQPVGDSTGVGGLIRAMRTVPMFEQIARAIKQYCPHAWVINYTNPMTVCVQTLYETFPGIKAFGCCHEVFGTQKLLVEALKDMRGIEAHKDEIRVNVTGINHFTWFTEAKYRNIDLFRLYREFSDKYYEDGFRGEGTGNWLNDCFACDHRVKFDLFRRYGYIAAAGDRHLAEFMDNETYLKDPQTVSAWHFGLTPVSWRKEDLKRRLARSERLRSGEETFTVGETGEEGVAMIRALLGLSVMVTNVNVPNRGQIPNLPMGAVVETNSVFCADTVTPVFAGEVPASIYALIRRVSDEMTDTVRACIGRDLGDVYSVFRKNHMTDHLSETQKKALFDEMVQNTKAYLKEYH